VPGVDGALVTFKLLPPPQRLQVPDERGFISTVGTGAQQVMRRQHQAVYCDCLWLCLLAQEAAAHGCCMSSRRP